MTGLGVAAIVGLTGGGEVACCVCVGAGVTTGVLTGAGEGEDPTAMPVSAVELK